ncbi:uncharacterized protein LOC115998861 [Ipomoea triloba]|uniref:uncharacterized protein LOC115998861 n=1 Tax=Ipomoea triloba TaxID=35885 RepID=UPI00125E0F0D|nr:uncharacterized protein LOC115998861 [Ipomoea triloba]
MAEAKAEAEDFTLQRQITTNAADGSAAAAAALGEEEPNLYAFEYDSLSPPTPTLSASFDDFNFAPNSPSHSHNSSDSLPNSLFYDDEDQMNFVTDLFDSRDDGAPNDVARVYTGGSNGVSSSEELELGLGLGLGFGSDFDPAIIPFESHSFPSTDGLRIVGMGSESDTEDSEVNSGVSYRNGDVPGLLNCLRFDNRRDLNEEFEWEEVNERVVERDNLSSMIDRIEEISVSSEISSSEGENSVSGDGGEEDGQRGLEWEVLLAMNDLERHLEFENDESIGDGISYLAVNDDQAYATDYDYDALFGQLLEIEGALKGSPPASKSVVESLPCVVFTDEEVSKNNVSCAVCKDDILVGEKVNRLPCAHHYHGDCIVPWLSIRNTCPVCRYELPTDDADYEKNKSEMPTGGWSWLYQ